MNNLKVTIAQYPIFWEDIDRNIKEFSQELDSYKGKTDLIVFPEMFTTGFTMNVKDFGEDMKGKAVRFIKDYSKKMNAAICGSTIIKVGKNYYNRLILGLPDGKIRYYDKRHLFRMTKEHSVYSSGNKQLVVKIKNWRIAFFICYDLRFPVWSRNRGNYDIAVYSANWPIERIYYWKSLLVARAIENQSYIIGANRTGTDRNGFKYTGESSVINPMGKYIMNAKNKSGLHSVELDMEQLKKFKEKFPAYKDADKFKIDL